MQVPHTLRLPAYAAPLAHRRARPNYVPPGYAPASYVRPPVVAASPSFVPGPAGTVRYSPASSPSMPPVVTDVDVDVDVDVDGEAELRRLRQGSGSFLLMLGIAFVLTIVASFGVVSRLGPSTRPAPVAAKSVDDHDQALEAERQLRATRGQGPWVELDGAPAAPSAIPSAAPSAIPSAAPSALASASAKRVAKPAKHGHE